MSLGVISDDRPVDPDDELLVAYLDGELDGEMRATVEQRLLDDDTLRSRLQSLQRGWDWLDELPEVVTSEKLVESTLELVVADLADPRQDASQSWMSGARLPLMILLGSLLSAAVAWASISIARQRIYNQQLRDLAIAENLDAYLTGSNLKLIRELSSNTAWDEMVASANAIGFFQVDQPSSIASVPRHQREAAIAEMPLGGRTNLGTRWDRFVRLAPEDRERVQQTAAEIAVQPDPEELLKTMRIYAVWRETLPRNLRTQLESDEMTVRRKAIDKAIEFTKTEVSQRSGSSLPEDETQDRILFVLKRIAMDRLQNSDANVQEFYAGLANRLGEADSLFILARGLLYQEDGRWDRYRRGPGIGPPGGGGSPSGPPRMSPITDRELMMIRSMLPTEVLEGAFYDLTFGDPQYELLVLQAWAEEAVRRRLWSSYEGQSSLLDRYLELAPNERERIDLLPPKDMLRELAPSWRRFRGGPSRSQP